MKKSLLLFLFIFLFFVNKSFAQDIRFIQVTDVHLTKNNAKYLKQFTEEFNREFNNIDFVVFTGDNIHRANIEDYLLFLNIIKNLKVKVYITAGNHDLLKTKGMTKENYFRHARKILGRYHPDKPYYVFKEGDIVFVVMNGVREFIPDASGYFRDDELRWLDKTLRKYKKNKVVILQHFPLLDTKVEGHNLYKKDKYEEILKKHNNVIAVISGHYHTDREEKTGNIHHIITKNFADNTYYKIIRIYDKQNFVFTSLVNNGAKF